MSKNKKIYILLLVTVLFVLIIAFIVFKTPKKSQTVQNQYETIQLDQTVKYGTEYAQNADKVTYEVSPIILPKLCQEQNVQSIEYQMKSGTGCFMIQKDVSRLKSSEWKELESTVENVPYILQGDNQDNICFYLYYHYQIGGESNMTEADAMQESLKDIEFTMKITFTDGSEETRLYKLGFKTSSSTKLSIIYQLV